jgi:hypothetical protein
MFSGIELSLFLKPPFHDVRIGVKENDSKAQGHSDNSVDAVVPAMGSSNSTKPELCWSLDKVPIASHYEWQALIQDLPWTIQRRKQMLTGFLQAKMESDQGEVQVWGVGFKIGIKASH